MDAKKAKIKAIDNRKSHNNRCDLRKYNEDGDKKRCTNCSKFFSFNELYKTFIVEMSRKQKALFTFSVLSGVMYSTSPDFVRTRAFDLLESHKTYPYCIINLLLTLRLG